MTAPMPPSSRSPMELIELSRAFLANYVKLNNLEREILIKVIAISSDHFGVAPIQRDYLGKIKIKFGKIVKGEK